MTEEGLHRSWHIPQIQAGTVLRNYIPYPLCNEGYRIRVIASLYSTTQNFNSVINKWINIMITRRQFHSEIAC